MNLIEEIIYIDDCKYVKIKFITQKNVVFMQLITFLYNLFNKHVGGNLLQS